MGSFEMTGNGHFRNQRKAEELGKMTQLKPNFSEVMSGLGAPKYSVAEKYVKKA